jgi:glyoxylase-like metal-dependent hydrolase (beta-lactamase superfamily II)
MDASSTLRSRTSGEQVESARPRPAQIKYVVISHAHGDHVGGAGFLQKRGAHIVMSPADWDLMERTQVNYLKPTRDIVATDGQKLTLGDTTVTLYITPGHTLGTISSLIPVKDGGRPHVAAYWGGTAFNWVRGPAQYITPYRPASFWFTQYAASARRFRDLAARAGADVLLSNHTNFDGSKTKIPALRAQAASAAHPCIVGKDAVRRYLRGRRVRTRGRGHDARGHDGQPLDADDSHRGAGARRRGGRHRALHGARGDLPLRRDQAVARRRAERQNSQHITD